MPNFKANGHQTSMPQDNVQKVNELLISWQLPQLCGKFQEEEICTNALLHLTDTDICELIPKIGPRAIFRAALEKWKRHQLENMSGHLRQITDKQVIDTSLESLMSPMPLVVKVEDTSTTAMEWQQSVKAVGENRELTPMREENESDAVSQSDNDNNPEDEEDEEEEEEELAKIGRKVEKLTKKAENETECTQIKLTGQGDKEEQLNVYDILHQSFDGRKALKFFEVNKSLDANHRRRCVKAVIVVAIEKRLTMTGNSFHSLAVQFVRIFPGETLSTYFVPRKGYICPRGALYNKYMNMCRHLRRDGLLEYRLKRNNCHNTRKRTPLNAHNEVDNVDIE